MTQPHMPQGSHWSQTPPPRPHQQQGSHWAQTGHPGHPGPAAPPPRRTGRTILLVALAVLLSPILLIVLVLGGAYLLDGAALARAGNELGQAKSALESEIEVVDDLRDGPELQLCCGEPNYEISLDARPTPGGEPYTVAQRVASTLQAAGWEVTEPVGYGGEPGPGQRQYKLTATREAGSLPVQVLVAEHIDLGISGYGVKNSLEDGETAVYLQVYVP